MSKIALLVDSASGIKIDELEEGIYVNYMLINFEDGSSLKDMVEVDDNQVYKRLIEGEVIKTSLPSIGSIKEIIEKIKEDGYDEVLGITLSKNLSGLYNALKIVSDEEDIKIRILDTKSISLAETLVIKYAKRLINENKEMNVDQLYEEVEKTIDDLKVYMYFDTLKYLIRGGRIGKVMGGLGSLLKIKPIVSCNSEGIYETITKVRSQDKALNEMCKRIKKVIENNKGKKHSIAFVYSNDETVKEKVESLLKDEIDSAIYYIKHDMVNSVIGVHSGPEAIGVAVHVF